MAKQGRGQAGSDSHLAGPSPSAAGTGDAPAAGSRNDLGDAFVEAFVRRPAVSVVIPALNEAENLPYVLPRIPRWVDEVVLVDGSSTDGTVEVARQLCPDIRVVVQEGHGKGAALRTGFAAAAGDIIVALDADGSTDPAEIPAFVGTLLAGADFAKGSRFLQGGGTKDMPLFRRIGNSTLVVVTNILFGTRFTDITYGYNAIWRCHTPALALEINGWACEIVNSIRAARNHLRIVEVASFENQRIAGEAKLRVLAAGWTILKAILRERCERRQSSLAPAPWRDAALSGVPGFVDERRHDASTFE